LELLAGDDIRVVSRIIRRGDEAFDGVERAAFVEAGMGGDATARRDVTLLVAGHGNRHFHVVRQVMETPGFIGHAPDQVHGHPVIHDAGEADAFPDVPPFLGESLDCVRIARARGPDIDERECAVRQIA
jgi:hypothetical protein